MKTQILAPVFPKQPSEYMDSPLTWLLVTELIMIRATVPNAPQTWDAFSRSSFFGYAQAASMAIHQPTETFLVLKYV